MEGPSLNDEMYSSDNKLIFFLDFLRSVGEIEGFSSRIVFVFVEEFGWVFIDLEMFD